MKKLLCVMVAALMLFAFAACSAETEPVRSENKPVGTPVGTEEVTTPEFKDGDTVIIAVSVYHGDGEVADTRMSAIKGNTLAETLLERTFITANFLTVDGEYANPDKGATWTLYVNGVYCSTSWDEVIVDNGDEFMFEYTAELDIETETDEISDDEGVMEETVEEENIGEPEPEV